LRVLVVLLAVAEADVMDAMGVIVDVPVWRGALIVVVGPSAWVDVTFPVVVDTGSEAVALVFVSDAVLVMVKLIVETPVPLQRLLYVFTNCCPV